MSDIYDLETIARGIANTITAGVSRTLYTYIAPSELGELPAVLVEPVAADFVQAMNRAGDEWEFIVYVLVARQDLPTAITELSGLLSGNGPDSIRRAIFDDINLGVGSNVQAYVHAMHGYGGSFKWYSVPHIGAALLVRVRIN